MGERLCTTLYVLLFVVPLWLTGCSSVTPTKFESESQGDALARGGSPSGGQVQEVTEPSSLEAFRSGGEMPSSRSSQMKDIYFVYNRSTLRPQARETLKSNAAWLQANRSVRVDIEGHAEESPLKEALAEMEEKSSLFRLIGAYPKAVN